MTEVSTLHNRIMDQGGRLEGTFTRVSGTQFKIIGMDYTTIIHKGMKIELSDGGVIKYGYISVAPSLSGSDTVINLTLLNTAAGVVTSLVNDPIKIYISGASFLRSHPIKLVLDNTILSQVGWSGTPTINSYLQINGGIAYVFVYITGTGSGTAVTLTLPIATVVNTYQYDVCCYNNSAARSVPGVARILTDGTVHIYLDNTDLGWTNGGTRNIDSVLLSYPIL